MEAIRDSYVHGYSSRERKRLHDQSLTLQELFYCDTEYSAGSKVLEAGCGVGAQTRILAKISPKARFTSIDVSEASLRKAKALIHKEKIKNVEFMAADVFDLPFENESFDHVFVCFLLEHLENPVKALQRLKTVLKKGGTMTVIEGDHGSAFFHPKSEYASKNIQRLIDLQERMRGDPLIGRRLFPLLKSAGYENVNVSPRFVYADSSRPQMVEGFTKKTLIAMVEGVREDALTSNMMSRKMWEKGMEDLKKTALAGGTFCYTFFKGTAGK